MKISVSMPDDLLQQIDEEAKKVHLSRSSFITSELAQRLQERQALVMMPKLLEALEANPKLFEGR